MITVEEKGKAIVLKVNGRLEINQSIELEETINNKIAAGHYNIILDLSEVHYLSSSGIRVFIATLRQLKENNGRLILANLNSNVLKTLKIVEMDTLFEIKETIEDALKSI